MSTRSRPRPSPSATLTLISGFFISMQGGSIIPQGFIGLANYFTLLGSIAYLVALAIGGVFIFDALDNH